MSDRVSRNIFGVQTLRGLSREGCIEVYIDNQRIFVIVYSFYIKREAGKNGVGCKRKRGREQIKGERDRA